MKIIIERMIDDAIEPTFDDFITHSREVKADVEVEGGVLRIVVENEMLETPMEIFHGIA